MTPRRRLYVSLIAAGTTIGLALAAPGLGQDSQEAPESLLPPGFGGPPAAQPAPTPNPTQSAPQAAPSPGATPAPATTPSPSATPVPTSPLPPEQPAITEADVAAEREAIARQYSLPGRARRGLDQIGVIDGRQGGVTPDSLGRSSGRYLEAMLRATRQAPVSRWGQIVFRRALASRLDTPRDTNGADFAAERVAMLVRMGEADAAVYLLQQVDGTNFTDRLMDVALQSYMAVADPAGLCPVVSLGGGQREEAEWQLMRGVCEALGGDISAGAAQIDRASSNEIAPSIDVLLAEKAVGAAGRRAVTIEWTGISELTPWRYGMALATGIRPPSQLMNAAREQMQVWQAQAPMLTPAARMNVSDLAAAKGVLSNAAMVDLYGAVYDDQSANPDLRARASQLRAAYVRQDEIERLEAMQALWARGSNDADTAYAMRVLTARAAARFPVEASYAEAADDLIAAMLSGGYDRAAQRWASMAAIGGNGWAMLAVSAPQMSAPLGREGIDGFIDADESDGYLRSRFLLAGLAGLDRVSGETLDEFATRTGLDLSRESRWTEAISAAASRGDTGLVMILTGVGMQADTWQQMSPLHLYHITRALRLVNREAEARMIAAEAVWRS